MYRDAITFYRVLKRNQERGNNSLPCSLKTTRSLLVGAYCVNQVKPTLTGNQIDCIKIALKDLNDRYPLGAFQKIKFLSFCVIHGIDFICRQHGKNRIRKFIQHQG